MAGRRASSARQRDIPERPDQRLLELAAFHALDDLVSLVPRHHRLVAAIFDQGRENVRNGQDTNQVRDIVGQQPIGIAAAIEIFMVVPHGIENFRRDPRIILQGFKARGGVGFDQRPFVRLQASGLVQDRQRNFRLADVVEHTRPYRAARDRPW